LRNKCAIRRTGIFGAVFKGGLGHFAKRIWWVRIREKQRNAGPVLAVAGTVLGKPATALSDLFTFGVLAYEWATGVRPF
jgi:hypothetical protein